MPNIIPCLNPNCRRPTSNMNNETYCITCGTRLGTNPIFRNRFKVLALLGQGAFGRTYKVEDRDNMDHLCVLKKLIYPVSNNEQAELIKNLFKREAKQLKELEYHPQIPSLYAYFEDSNNLYLVQQFIEGQNLLDKLFKTPQKRFPPEQIIELLQNILPILDFIHKQGILHRDIKPENMMYSSKAIILPNQEKRHIVLIDFGAAKQKAGTVTQSSPQNQRGTQIYTPGYAADEHKNGFPIAASDIYSLGMTCIRLLTGEIPGYDSGLGEAIDRLYDPLENCFIWRPVLQQKSIMLNPQLADLLDKMTKPVAKHRYQRANEVLADLNQILNPTQTSSSSRSNSIPPTILEPTVLVNDQIFDLGNGVSMELVEIPAGNFVKHWENNQLIKINKFFMAKHPITNQQWYAIMRTNPSKDKHGSKFAGAKQPVVGVNWNDAQAFCQKLSEKTKRKFRLPTEAKWEYAARGGTTTTKYHFGNDDNQLDQYAWYSKNSGSQTHDVMLKKPNQYGLYDMMGNVWEWCEDKYKNDDSNRVVRGGSCFNISSLCAMSCRFLACVSLDWYADGFRVVLGA